jgi:hypothetical protein
MPRPIKEESLKNVACPFFSYFFFFFQFFFWWGKLYKDAGDVIGVIL